MDIFCAVFVIAYGLVVGIPYLLNKSKEKMGGGGWGYRFNIRKNARRE